jgi:hypothetical protein
MISHSQSHTNCLNKIYVRWPYWTILYEDCPHCLILENEKSVVKQEEIDSYTNQFGKRQIDDTLQHVAKKIAK